METRARKKQRVARGHLNYNLLPDDILHLIYTQYFPHCDHCLQVYAIGSGFTVHKQYYCKDRCLFNAYMCGEVPSSRLESGAEVLYTMG